ncbi:MAG: hypothetical protein COB36_07495 [Alphaproteobacteria bacterium]|nr:MAG: hypothetical protein COB36_07495 [Alphaproteobacteria bacterium]
MIQEIFNSLKKLMAHHKEESHKELHGSFENQFTNNGTTLVELLVMSPELNGEGKENPDDYFSGINYSLPVAMYIIRRAMEEEKALEEERRVDTSAALTPLDSSGEPDPLEGQTPYKDHLDKNYTTLSAEIITTHQKNDETLQVEDIRIPPQEFIENLTNECLQELQTLDVNNTIEPEQNTSEIS